MSKKNTATKPNQSNKTPPHFEGKDPLAHIISAKKKGQEATNEPHGQELPGHYHSAADTAKEIAIVLMLLSILLTTVGIEKSLLQELLLAFSVGFLAWKTGRSAHLGWSRLERLHRLIEEERWEIEHHRPQEKEELRALYAAKGFSGKLLDEAVDTLMADDNRLLQVMLEEELGLKLEAYEHPLKQAFGALLGGLIASSLMMLTFFFLKPFAMICMGLILAICSGKIAQLEKNQPLNAIIWDLAVGVLAVSTTYFILQMLFGS